MLKVLDWVLGKEPVAAATGIAAVVTALLGALTAFDVLNISAEQIAAVGALAAALAGWAGRSAVTPVSSPGERQLARAFDKPLGTDTVADDTRLPDEGGIPLALIILVIVGVLILGGVFASCDALFTDSDEEGDLNMGLPALVLDHDRYRCMDHDYCGGGGSDGNTGYDGEGGRSGDMDQGGDNNCRNFCDNIIYIPDPRGGEERPR